jgi:stage V sporulation protein AD
MFDEKEDDRFEQKTWEQSESEMQRRVFAQAALKAGCDKEDIDAIFAGDLENQCIASTYGLLSFYIPYFGLYGACSTAVQGMLLSSMCVSADIFPCCASVTSSHFCTAERQFRMPIEYGSQKTPTAQRTVTGAAAFIQKISDGKGAIIKEGVCGITREYGITDTANMGAAMAPAALDTLLRYFKASGKKPCEFDMILTGDLGYEGGDILCRLMKAEGYDIFNVYQDCGKMIFSQEEQDTHAGGSGCACSATVFSAYILPKIRSGELKDILLIGTGAMMSPLSITQGESIPSIAHLVRICCGEQ